MGAIEATVSAIVDKVGPVCQLVVICGRNKKLVEKLKARCDKIAPLKAPSLIGFWNGCQQCARADRVDNRIPPLEIYQGCLSERLALSIKVQPHPPTFVAICACDKNIVRGSMPMNEKE